MATDLAKVIQASAFLIAGSVIYTGGMVCTFVLGGTQAGIAAFVLMVPLGTLILFRAIRGMPSRW
ncbi:hypothetical protein K9N68_17025 [Kovacikia minuta CCNUW1]|uniref:hypothetical protein n=1 Tax=Kovacikia minuta TaxID=2931930 RepID=UPI001CCE3963|nr:hypothetical protein [Kovacikia minuta]UBF29382.1 hypothetical protein K9N68_17025 [Kovacikia minuta CCNUW1]